MAPFHRKNFSALLLMGVKPVAVSRVVVDRIIYVIIPRRPGFIEFKQIVVHGGVIDIGFVNAEIHTAGVVHQDVAVLLGVDLIDIRVLGHDRVGQKGGDKAQGKKKNSTFSALISEYNKKT